MIFFNKNTSKNQNYNMKAKKNNEIQKKKPNPINIISLINNKFFLKPKLTTITHMTKEKSVPKTTRTQYSFNFPNKSKNVNISKPIIKKVPEHKKKHAILISGINSTKISFEKNSHTIVNSITSFNTKVNNPNNTKQNLNISKYPTHTINKTSTNFSSRPLSIGGKNMKPKGKVGKCSINSIYVKLDDIMGAKVITDPNDFLDIQGIKPKKEIKKVFTLNHKNNNKTDINCSNVDVCPQYAITEVDEVQKKNEQKKNKLSNGNIKVNLLSLIQENKKNLLLEKIKNKNVKNLINIKSKVSKTEYTLDNILNHEKNDEKEHYLEFDNFDDLYSIVKKINFDKIDPLKENIFSSSNLIYDKFSNEYNKLFNTMFSHNKLSESKLSNISNSTQDNSNKKKQLNKMS